MMRTRHGLYAAGYLALGMLLAGCVTAPPYVPDAGLRSRVTPVQARAFLKGFTGGCFNTSGWEDCVPVTNLHVADGKLQLVRRSDGAVYRFPLNDVVLRVDSIAGQPTLLVNQYRLWGIGHGTGTNGMGALTPAPDGLGYARQLADAITVLKDAEDDANSPEDDAGFAQAVQAYRDAAVKPEIPEDARRFKVQAEQAVKETRFADAADLYGQALTISPWWPEGRYNRALILAELREYPGAIKEMNRYLALVPEAPNARAAKDKVYVWEGQIQAAPTANLPATQKPF